ncbi:hypothetical protein CYMTET_43645 [Cymbomonas tetramitiformis]|nr:hypothetical protein CYMTET_43645 [Cymbomonas tetramitiformis]
MLLKLFALFQLPATQGCYDDNDGFRAFFGTSYSCADFAGTDWCTSGDYSQEFNAFCPETCGNKCAQGATGCGSGERKSWSGTARCCSDNNRINQWDYNTDGESGSVRVRIEYEDGTYFPDTECTYDGPNGNGCSGACGDTYNDCESNLWTNAKAGQLCLAMECRSNDCEVDSWTVIFSAQECAPGCKAHWSGYFMYARNKNKGAETGTTTTESLAVEIPTNIIPVSTGTEQVVPPNVRKQQLVAFYHQRSLTAQVEQVDSILEAYSLEQISASCQEKYGADPFAQEHKEIELSTNVTDISITVSQTGDDAANSSAQTRKEQLAIFYQQRNLTAQVEQVDAIMETYTAEQISASCMEKYGADPFAGVR